MVWLTDVRYKGKHRELNNNDRKASAALALLLATGLSSITHGDAAADPPGGWDSIIACESGGRNVHTAISGPFTASGYFQITNGTWRANGGLAFAPTAMQASFAEQKVVANNIFRRNPSLSDWSASRSCLASGKKRVTIQGVSPAPQQRVPLPNKPVPAAGKPKTKPPVVRVTPPTGHRVHIVRRGETLTRISGSHWRATWTLNRGVIGGNPNRIYPGQRLILP
jgi:hypothetical protein